MSVIMPVAPAQLQVPPYPIWKFTVDQYHQMIQVGLLTEDDGVELLEGWIVQKMPRNPPHDGTIALGRRHLGDRLSLGWHIRVQSAVTFLDSEPEPDLAIVRGVEEDYLSRHPGPADIALVIEVADSSLERDRSDKGRIYARAGIVLYWIINIVDEQVEVYSAPTGPVAAPGYGRRQDYSLNDTVPLDVEGTVVGRIAVRDLVP